MSHIPAYGLMQIVPTTAGRDVFDHPVRNLPYRETRDYLPKVIRLKDKCPSVG